jgi:hypothetical protein
MASAPASKTNGPPEAPETKYEYPKTLCKTLLVWVVCIGVFSGVGLQLARYFQNEAEHDIVQNVAQGASFSLLVLGGLLAWWFLVWFGFDDSTWKKLQHNLHLLIFLSVIVSIVYGALLAIAFKWLFDNVFHLPPTTLNRPQANGQRLNHFCSFTNSTDDQLGMPSEHCCMIASCMTFMVLILLQSSSDHKLKATAIVIAIILIVLMALARMFAGCQSLLQTCVGSAIGVLNGIALWTLGSVSSRSSLA